MKTPEWIHLSRMRIIDFCCVHCNSSIDRVLGWSENIKAGDIKRLIEIIDHKPWCPLLPKEDTND